HLAEAAARMPLASRGSGIWPLAFLEERKMKQGSMLHDEWPVIASYSRADALADGVLRDAGELAREAGLGFPVALTAAAWEAAVSPNDVAGQDERGRLWDVLFMLRMSIS